MSLFELCLQIHWICSLCLFPLCGWLAENACCMLFFLVVILLTKVKTVLWSQHCTNLAIKLLKVLPLELLNKWEFPVKRSDWNSCFFEVSRNVNRKFNYFNCQWQIRPELLIIIITGEIRLLSFWCYYKP